MTMFRRVFSNHFVGPDSETGSAHLIGPDDNKPPAPPSAPPVLAPCAPSTLTEMSQTVPKDGFTFPLDDKEGGGMPHKVTVPAEPEVPPAGDRPDISERAAQIHAEILARTRRSESAQMDQIGAPQDQDAPTAQPEQVPRRSSRTRTRLLGFDAASDVAPDPMKKGQINSANTPQLMPAGWIVVTDGPGVGHSFPLFGGVAMIGRGEDQSIRLDFGDQAISRQNHAALAYDSEDNKFHLGHGGKSNIVKHNGRPVLSTEEMRHGDMIRIGETMLRFVALCDDDFQWGGGIDA